MRHRPIALALCAVLGVSAAAAVAAAPNWLATVVLTPAGGHLRGNPAAPHKIAAWISYTCSHCAAFEREADGPLQRAWIGPGKASLEIRHLLRDPVDATVAQLANCGAKEKFFGNHAAFMRGQEQWMAPIATASDAQRARWTSGDHAARRRAIAADFHLYEWMAKRGYTRAQLDGCLADEALARRLAAQTVEATRRGFDGTPAFALNGAPLFGTNTWATLEAQLAARR